MLKSYLKKLLDITGRGDAREESYYEALSWLLSGYAESSVDKDIRITTLPKRTEAGNPDFRIWDGEQHIVGYIEAKPPTTENLDHIETTEQLKRYRHTFPNLILTNFFEFRLYRDGNVIDRVNIARPFIMHELGKVPPVEKKGEFFNLLEKFFSFSLPKVYNAEKLAIELAKRTRFLRDEVIAEELQEEETRLRADTHRQGNGKGYILGFYDAFKKCLISSLSKKDFADLYSQTITYGLFAARTRSEDSFNRKLAYDNIPHTIGILRDVFEFISLGKVPVQMEWIIDDISEVLAVTDVRNILHEYFHEGKGKDPIVHFYETFLAEYDPKTREKRGVYYTPEPVVSYIVRSLHHILKEHFNKPDGFASDSVTVLDPAAGTLTFMAEAAKLAVEEFVSKYGEGGKEEFIKDHILENFYAFELMMAPYAVGHLKMSFLLEELGYKLKEDDRFKLYLTNTLEMEELAESQLPGMASLSEESHLAGKVKQEQPILVILGNPPYSAISANMGVWIDDLLKQGYLRADGSKDDGYYRVDGKPLGEKKLWLQDDYVKFIRFAQWKIDQAGEGVLGFITNHSYLDNPTFRGMRESLMNSFNESYILDLHGNTLKKEKCPDGSKDENVFDIRPGVAIALFIKKKDKKKECKVYHSEAWGLRDEKYDWLVKNEMKTTEWKKIVPSSPYYFLVPREEKGREIYEKYWKLTDIFPVNVTGIVTARDKFVIDFGKEPLKSRVMTFRNKDLPDEIIKEGLKLKENYQWRVSKARKELMSVDNWEKYFTKILYRPFDIRHIYYHDSVVWRTRKEVMRHLFGDNLSICFMRQVSLDEDYTHFLVSKYMVDNRTFLSSKGIIQQAPLYLYSDTEKKDLFKNKKEPRIKEPNIKSELFAILAEVYKREPSPEDIFFYIYGVLYSNIYREKYAEFLKIDFPRVPFTKDYKLFSKIGEYGKRLVDLHLLKSKELDPPIAKFQGEGDERVERYEYDKKGKRVYINKNQYFEGILEEVWKYQIGGYQVCRKWLRDRKNAERTLSLDDIKQYCKIVTSLQKTIQIQKQIDKIYPKIEKKIVEFMRK